MLMGIYFGWNGFENANQKKYSEHEMSDLYAFEREMWSKSHALSVSKCGITG